MRTLANSERVYWDACAWLGLVNGEAERKTDLKSIYQQARDGQVEIWTSVISVVQANRLKAELGSPKPISPDSISALDDVFFQPFVKLVALDVPISRDARKLVRETPNLSKKPDAIHLATALFWSVPVMHTYDGNDLLHLDGKMACRDGSRLRIIEPSDIGDGGLFDKSRQ